MSLQYLPIAIFHILTFHRANGDVYFVAPDVADCNVSTSCNTLSYYASSTTQQLTDSVFYFMRGTHLLQQTWIIENASNLTLTGRSPDSKMDEEVIVECTTSSTDQGIRVINGRHIALEYMDIFHCQQGADGVLQISSALLCDSTNNLELWNMKMGFSPESCLNFVNCNDYVISDSVFINNGYAFLTEGPSSGNVTSSELVNNTFGILAYDTANLVTMLLAGINAYNNSGIDFYFSLCTANISLRQSLSNHSGGFTAMQACPYSESYTIDIQNCNFGAMEGGFTISLFQTKNVHVKISSCLFSNTSENAIVPGIVIAYFPLRAEKEGRMGKFTIEDVTMENIHVPGSILPVLLISSILQVNITNLCIVNNGHGALELDDSTALFRGKNSFTNNSGIYGGGMALYGSSYVSFVNSSDSMEFINNKAEKFGGGIFVSQDTKTVIDFCFMQTYAQWPTFTFQGNAAGFAGSQLYGGRIDTCVQLQSDLKFTDVLGFLTNTTQCNQTEVSSNAVNLALCDQYCIDTTRTVKSVRTYPGTTLNISIAAIGQLDGLTQATVLLTYEEVFDHDKSDESQFISAICTNISRDIRVKRTNTTGNINLTLSDYYISASTNKPVIINVIVELLACPPGFNFSKVNEICVCSDTIKNHAECDITLQAITRYDISWIYPTNESIMIFEHCPFDYCNTEPFSVDNPDGQCDNSRSGILCGDCIQGYSLTLGSNKCWNCKSEVWQVPVILFGSALAGIGLVAVLIVLNLTVSVGTINGLLFFINVVKIYESILFQNNPSEVLQYFFSWLNLDLGIITCFYEGMDACQKVGLQFVFPMYLIVLVMVIVAVCRCGQWIGLRSLPWVVKLSDKTALLMGSKIIPVLATLLLFSYTKLIRSTILIYHKADIQVFESNPNTSDFNEISRWYVNGSVEYLTGCHKDLFSVGTGIIVPLISLFTAFLLFFPVMERYLPRFKFWISWHMRLKPWYDAYGGPYKDEYRFWTGLLLLVRCLLVVVVSVFVAPNVASSVLMWVCLTLIPMVAMLQVYKSSFLNVLEIIYLSSILAMVFLSTASQDDVQLPLVISISLCLLFTILLFHIGQRLKPIWSALMDMRKKPSASEQEHLDNKDEENANKNVPISIISSPDSTELRESLLSDNN